MQQKAFFIIFKGPSVAKNCLIPYSAPLSMCNLLVGTSHYIGLTIKIRNNNNMNIFLPLTKGKKTEQRETFVISL